MNRLQKIIFLQAMLLFSGVLFVYGQKVRRIDYASEYAEGVRINGEDVQKLMNNVMFKDSSTTMYCDSAYFYPNNDIDAYGSIRIFPRRGGSNTKLTGKFLHYNAFERVANISQEVVLNDDKTILKTDIIYYNLNTGTADYPTPGEITKEDTRIVSKLGMYDTNNRTFHLKKNVVVTNPSYRIKTDTMDYITYKKIVEFQGPTIITSDSDSIYCERGWYNTSNDISEFRKNAWLKGRGKVIKGDTLYYEKLTGNGKGYGNVEIWDTTQNIRIRGNYAYLNRPKQIAVVTKKALMIWADVTDSLYLHADTIRTGVFTELRSDSVTFDTFKYVKAYYHVKFFKSSFQGCCDSMFYSLKDSSLEMHRNPILWAGLYQLTADYAKMFTKNQKMDRLQMDGSPFIVSKEDTSHYNQIKGKNMMGFFKDNDLTRLEVKGNGQSIYFPIDQGEVQGVDKNESSNINLYFEKRQLNKITYINSVTGDLTPLAKFTQAELFLKDFNWHSDKRPVKWQDVFLW